MDLWQLHIFCKVVELKSFSKAGDAVHLSQPTVSNHIKDLEEHTGCRLIDRLSKECLPTKAGELLYSYATRLLSLRDEAQSALSRFQGELQGCLGMGGSTIPGGYLLPKIVSRFIQKYPKVRISLRIGDTKGINAAILSGTIELGLVGARATARQLSQEKVLEDTMCVVVPSGHKWAQRSRIALSALLKEPFIIREQGSGTLKSLTEQLAAQGYHLEDLNIIGEMGSTQAVVQSIKCGMGLSILSPIGVADELRSGAMHCLHVDGLSLRRSFYLTTHRHRSQSPLAAAFVEFLVAYLKDPLEQTPNGWLQ